MSNDRDNALIAEGERRRKPKQAGRATKAQQQAQATLATVQAHRDDTQRSYQDVVSKYAASQKEVRALQGRLDQCGRSTAPP